MRHSKTSLAVLLLGSAALALAGAAWADTPKDTVVMAKQIDDIISLDPGEVFEFSGGEIRRVFGLADPDPAQAAPTAARASV